jgi:flavin-binding protein dodecin
MGLCNAIGRERSRLVEIDLRQAQAPIATAKQEVSMPESVYKVIELVGTSTESWEKAAKAAVDRAAKTLRDLRVAEVVEQDLQLKDGKVEAYRDKVKVSFKYEGQG